MDRLPKRLLEAREQGALVPFVGAGVSMAVRRLDGSAAFPSWIGLLEAAADELDHQQQSEAAVVRAMLGLTPPNTLDAARYAQQGLRAQWSEFLRDHFDVRRRTVSGDTLELARAVWALASQLVITTNYDRVLRWSCPDAPDLTEWMISAPSEQVAMLQGRLNGPTVWHLHGSLADATQIILSPDGYATLYPSDVRAGETVHKAALETLRILMTSKTFLFVGFSLADPYLKRQFEWVHETFAGCGGPHYVVAREAESDGLQANIGGLDLRPICVGDYADIPVLLRAIGANATREPMAESPPVTVPSATVGRCQQK